MVSTEPTLEKVSSRLYVVETGFNDFKPEFIDNQSEVALKIVYDWAILLYYLGCTNVVSRIFDAILRTVTIDKLAFMDCVLLTTLQQAIPHHYGCTR